MINPVSNSNQAAAIENNLDVVGKEDFLKLLVTQLQNQDPLNPQDPTEFTSQLAEFSSLEQMFNMNKSLGGMTDSMAQLGQVGALSMLGKEVVSEGGRLSYSGNPIEVGYYIPADVESAAVNIIDENNHVIKTIQGDQLTAGEHYLSWDGTMNDGSLAPNGDYTISIRAMIDEDTIIPAVGLVRGTVTGVDFTSSNPSLETSFGDTPLTTLVRAYENK